MNTLKSICINDYITVPFKRDTLTCPINGITMSSDDIWQILNIQFPPTHIYAICTKDKSKSALITRDNFMKSEEELFPEVYGETTVIEETVVTKPEQPEIFSEIVKESEQVETSPVVEEVTTIEEPVKVEETVVIEEPVSAEKTDDVNEEFLVGGNASSFQDETAEPVVNDVIETEDVKPETIPAQSKQNQNYNKNKKKKNR